MQVPPDRRRCKRIAETTGGKYFAPATRASCSDIYESLGSRIGFKQERREITAAFAAGGLALMMIGGAFSLVWFGRLP